MKLWNKSKPEPEARAETEPDRLAEIGNEKNAAAVRLTAAIAELGAATKALFDADRAFALEWEKRHGNQGHGTSRLFRQFRMMLLGNLELSATDLLRHLDQSRQPRVRAVPISEHIQRQVEQDLATEAQLKESAA